MENKVIDKAREARVDNINTQYKEVKDFIRHAHDNINRAKDLYSGKEFPILLEKYHPDFSCDKRWNLDKLTIISDQINTMIELISDEWNKQNA